jgi:NAD(P)-dependent dehydrogenase (short-subunit alcohol dehydrogenase family)
LSYGASRGGRETLIADVERDLGPVDVMVNNSALGGYKPFEDWTLEQLQKGVGSFRG